MSTRMALNIPTQKNERRRSEKSSRTNFKSLTKYGGKSVQWKRKKPQT